MRENRPFFLISKAKYLFKQLQTGVSTELCTELQMQTYTEKKTMYALQ